MRAFRLATALVAIATTGFVSATAIGANWVGGNANWGNVSPTVPGWSTLTAPNGVGEVAQKIDAVSGTATIDAGFGPVTLGSIIMGGTANNAFGITPTAGLTLDQDGAGPGFALISQQSTSTGTNPAVVLNAGVVTLADDLRIENTNADANRTTGAVIISSTLTGSGNVTLSSAKNLFPASSTSFAGAIRLQTGVNSFVGNVLLEKGLVTFNNSSSFGSTGNLITIGSAGMGSATMVSTAAGIIVPNNIDIAAGTGGETIVGSVSTSTAATYGYSGTITLNGNLTVVGLSTSGTGPNFSGQITGAGSITKSQAGIVTFSNASNNYAGTTTVNAGTLMFTSGGAIGGSGASMTVNMGATAGAGYAMDQGFIDRVVSSSAGVVGLGANSANNLDFSAAGANLTAASLGAVGGTLAAPQTYSGMITPNSNTYRFGGGGGVLNVASNLNGGSNSLVIDTNGTSVNSVAILSGTNNYGGTTTVNGQFGYFNKQVSLYNNTPAMWTDANIKVTNAAVLGLSVGGAGEFTSADVQIISGLGSPTGGFADGTWLGLDTTSGSTTISANMSNANVMGLWTTGANNNILTLNGNNSYTGSTVIQTARTLFAKRSSLYNATPANWTAANINVLSGATAAFSVGGVDEFTAADIDILKTLGSATTGFRSGSFLGFDTTNTPGGEFIYSSVIAPPGAQTMGVAKLGANTLTLSAVNTYTGGTTVDGGTLKVTGTHTTGTATDYRLGTRAGYEGTLLLPGTATVTTARLSVGDGSIASGGIGHVTQETGSVLTASTYLAVGNNDGTTGDYTQNGGSVTTTSDTTANTGPIIGWWGNGTYTMNGGTMTSRSWVTVGYGGGPNPSAGTLTLNNGTILVNDNGTGGGAFGLGRAANGTGTLLMQNGSITVNNDWFVVGVAGKGTATINNGTISCSTLAVAQTGAASMGTFNINGGTITTTANMYVVAGTGVVNQTGGDLKVGTWFTLGEGATSNATYNMSGGTMSTGNVAAENFVVAYAGQATVNQTGGDITVRGDWNLGWTATGNGTHNISNGTLTVINNNMFAGIDGIATLNQSGGTITVPLFSAVGRGATGQGTYNMSGGVSNWGSDLNIGDFGKGFLNQTGGTINAFAPIFGWRDISEGTGTINGANAVLNATGTGGLFIGLFGKGTLDLMQGQINVPGAAAAFTIGDQAVATSNGTFNQSGGAVVVSNQTYVGDLGTGVYNMSGGTYSAGDNLYIGFGAVANGTLTQTAGTITVVGNDPTYTGNVVMGRLGTAALNMQGGTLDMIVSGYVSVNSLSYSIANSMVPNLYSLAQDGNLMIGERTGTATVTQSGGLIKVAANVFVGSVNVLDSAFDGTATGTLTITGGEMRVGVTSVSGGDMVIGGTGASGLSQGDVSLQGGTLDVSKGAIGAGVGPASFAFTGGTLKVKEFNVNTFGGSLGNLAQNGMGSLLDVTGNNTTIHSTYDLGQGTATIGTGRTLTADAVSNSAGAGVINVGTGAAAPLGDYNNNGTVDAADYVLWRRNPGSYGGDPGGYNTWRANFGSSSAGPGNLNVGAGTVAVDTLNLNAGSVTANGGVTVATALTGNGSITGNTAMGVGASVSPGLAGAAGELTFANNLTLNGTGALNIQIGGGSAGQFDKLAVTSLLTVGGTLNVSLINGFVPTVGQAFDILDFGSLAGTFATVPSPANWDTSDLLTLGVIKFVALGAGSGLDGGAVPEPTTLALLILAACGFATRRSARSLN